MVSTHDDITFNPDKLHFVPLGGSEEFGVNFNVYAYQGKFLTIDCGIGFADHRYPGIDILLPDPSFFENRADDLEGLIVTHAHEDHVGAVHHLWEQLRCPIYCTAFTAEVLKRKFSENPVCQDAEIVIVKAGDVVDIGPFKAEFIHVSHSIPNTVSVVLHTDQGSVVHSGDWNLDAQPVLEDVTDEDAFKRIGEGKVLAYIGDSTNANVDGRSGSEADVAKGLESVFKTCKGRILITIFASNVGRIHSIAKAAEASGRKACIVGRSLHTMTAAAKNCGYLQDIDDFLSEEEIGFLPDDKQVIIATGSQGEGRAALARIAAGTHPEISVQRGDTVIFSARAIPGNDKDIDNVKNNLVAGGVQVIDPDTTSEIIHVSGHPRRGEITDMFSWLKPNAVIPVHGERMQLEAHAALARSCQVSSVVVPNNGSIVQIDDKGVSVVGHIETGLLAIEPGRTISSDHVAIARRRKLQYSGTLYATLVVNKRGDLVADPQVSSIGLIDHDDPDEARLEDDLIDEITDVMASLDRKERSQDAVIAEEVRIHLRRYVNYNLKIRPLTIVHVIRL